MPKVGYLLGFSLASAIDDTWRRACPDEFSGQVDSQWRRWSRYKGLYRSTPNLALGGECYPRLGGIVANRKDQFCSLGILLDLSMLLGK